LYSSAFLLKYHLFMTMAELVVFFKASAALDKNEKPVFAYI
jgi:hypothetical protein